MLDALERDLFAAPTNELRDTLRETGRARQAACQEVRALLNDAISAVENNSTMTISFNHGTNNDLLRH